MLILQGDPTNLEFVSTEFIKFLLTRLSCVCSFSRRLAKSTLLLIPLFGINYVVFVYLMEPTDKNMEHIKIFFELGLGSFQVTCDRFHFSPVSSRHYRTETPDSEV